MPSPKKAKKNKWHENTVSDERINEETKENNVAPCSDEDLQHALEQVMQEGITEVPIDSLEAAIEYGSLIREMEHAYISRVAFYRSTIGGSLSLEDAREAAYHKCKDKEEAAKIISKLRSYSLDIISFADLYPLLEVAPRIAEKFWFDMKVEALMEFESGHLASKSLLHVEYMRTAWNAACYLGIRSSLKAEWQPRGGIELSLIDMMAQAFLQYQYWVKESVLRSQTRPREEHPKYREWKRWQIESKTAKSWDSGYWFPQYVSEQAAQEFAINMADKWNRIYLRNLRALRDLRRYSMPVTINNPQQVNIATDGGQQVNVAKGVKNE